MQHQRTRKQTQLKQAFQRVWLCRKGLEWYAAGGSGRKVHESVRECVCEGWEAGTGSVHATVVASGVCAHLYRHFGRTNSSSSTAAVFLAASSAKPDRSRVGVSFSYTVPDGGHIAHGRAQRGSRGRWGWGRRGAPGCHSSGTSGCHSTGTSGCHSTGTSGCHSTGASGCHSTGTWRWRSRKATKTATWHGLAQQRSSLTAATSETDYSSNTRDRLTCTNKRDRLTATRETDYSSNTRDRLQQQHARQTHLH
jgi:hypothetical protein